MADERLSRRDWLQLRPPAMEHELLGTTDMPALQRVAEPPNHDGLDMSKLPKVHEALLSVEQVTALLADIEHCASDIQLVARGTASAKSDSTTHLRVLCEKFMKGEVVKIQIRYRWQETHWIDTLDRQPTGARLVRIGHS